MVKFRHYAIATAVVTASAVAYAAHTRKHFYNTSIYLTTNKLNIVVLVNVCFLFLCLLGMFLKRVFLGTLTRDELEELVQQSKYAITETMLALTIFREELNLKMLVLFTALIFIKIFHWLAAMRVEALARSEGMGRWQHVRLMSLMAFLALVDITFVLAITLALVRSRTASVLLLFGFEYLILSVGLASTWCKYVMLVLDARWEARGQHWANKNTWMFYLELSGDLLRLCLYLLFFLIICNFYGLPLHLIRELGITFYNLRERLVKFIHYRRITQNMQTRFPDATAAELEQGDRTCIVCREDMEVGHTKKLPCGHMFHFACLRTWLERSQSCPTCRREIPVNAPAVPPPAPAAAAAGAAAPNVPNANAAVAAPPAAAPAAPVAPGGPPAAQPPAAPPAAAPTAHDAIAAALAQHGYLPADATARLSMAHLRVPQRQASRGASDASASPLHPLFGSTPLPPVGGGSPHSGGWMFPSPHGAFHHPLMSPLAQPGAPFMPAIVPPLVFPPPPVPPPPAHMFPVHGGGGGSAASSPAGSLTSPFGAGAAFMSALPPTSALHAAYLDHHRMLLQHHADFLQSSLAQVRILQEQQREMDNKFRAQQAESRNTQQAQTREPTANAPASSEAAPSGTDATLTQRRIFSPQSQ